MRWRVAPTPRFSGTRNLFIDIEIYLPATPRTYSRGREIGKGCAMRVLIVGGPEITSVGEELEAAGVTVDHRDDDAPASGGPQEIAEIAADLREFERTLSENRVDAVLVASSSAAALAAVIIATKAGVPVARLRTAGGATDEGANARLIAQLADSALAPEAAAVVDWA